MRYMMIVTYNGRGFYGFQRQREKNTIQDKLEDALEILFKQHIETVASGRTDAMVSAYNQPVHFDIDREIDTKKFMHSMNGILPNTIKIKFVVPTEHHARFSAKKKTYLYKMYISDIDLPIYNALRLDNKIDIDAMKEFANMLIGEHDFAGFCAKGGMTKTTVRTIYNIEFKQGVEEHTLNFYITGNGFLYKMVRNIVGTMIEIGMHRLDLNELKNTLFSTYRSTYTAKPEHLYLYDVKYE